MSPRLIFQADSQALLEHPAVSAWNELGLSGPVPLSVEVLRTRRGKALKKSSIFRLQGVGVDGASVIAKRAPQTSMLVERIVYQDILPSLPLRALHCYGFLAEKNGGHCWLFLEDARGQAYSESLDHHRALASDWLGILHGATTGLEAAARLPGVTSDRYLNYLRWSRKTIRENITNSALDGEAVSMLKNIARYCDRLESRWREIEAFYQTMPRCLVHGDFIQKNVRIRIEPEPAVCVMDWEAAGWGVPAEDIAGLDLETYWSRVGDYWPQVGRAALDELASTGTIFHCLALIQATSHGLAHEWIERPVRDLKSYELKLAAALRTAGWA